MYSKENERLIKIEEICLIVGVSIQTINNWYHWKRLNPDHELAKLLPDYIQDGARQTRYWKQKDVWDIIKFREARPMGRCGILGDVTQINARKKRAERKEKENSKN